MRLTRVYCSSSVERLARMTMTALFVCGLAYIASADCTYTLSTYCAGCARIGGSTSFTLGPYSSKESCESARADGVRRASAGVSVGPCVQHGVCQGPPPSSGQAESRPKSDLAPLPTIDAPVPESSLPDDRAQAAAEQARRRDEEFQRDKADMLKALRGPSWDAPAATETRKAVVVPDSVPVIAPHAQDNKPPTTVNGHPLTRKQQEWLRYISTKVLPSLGNDREQGLDAVAKAAWWALREGFLDSKKYPDPTSASNCTITDAKGNHDVSLPLLRACPPGRAWQVGLFGVQVHTAQGTDLDQLKRVRRSITETWGTARSEADILQGAAQLARVDGVDGHGDPICGPNCRAIVALKDTSANRPQDLHLLDSWLLRDPMLAALEVARYGEGVECFGGRDEIVRKGMGIKPKETVEDFHVRQGCITKAYTKTGKKVPDTAEGRMFGGDEASVTRSLEDVKKILSAK